MFQQALNTSAHVTVTFILLLLCVLFLECCNQSMGQPGYFPQEEIQQMSKEGHLLT